MSDNNKTYSIRDGNWRFNQGVSKSRLDAGFYTLDSDFSGVYLCEAHFTTDKIVDIPNPASEQALNIASRYIAGEFREPMASIGMLHKMSLLLWGAPGTSKTVTTSQIVKYAINHDWVAIDGGSSIGEIQAALNSIRGVEPDRGIVVIIEEFDDMCKMYEEEILQLLDGSCQHENILYVLTTNFVEKLPARIFLRTKRIAFQVKFDFPKEKERLAYFKAKIPTSFNEEEWLRSSEGFSIDQCSHLITSVYAYGHTLEDAVADIHTRFSILGLNTFTAPPDPKSDDYAGYNDVEESYGSTASAGIKKSDYR